MRDAVYMPEFRQLSTAVSTTAFMMWSAYGMPISVNAATNGDAPAFSSFHGRMTASRNAEPTKNTAIRMITELAAFATARSGSDDSAAAIVAISAPTMEKITVTTPTVIGRDTEREEPAVGPQVGEVHRLVRPQAEHEERAESDERDDRGHLDAGEPELELTERRHREQVGRGHQDHQDQSAATTAECRSSTG